MRFKSKCHKISLLLLALFGTLSLLKSSNVVSANFYYQQQQNAFMNPSGNNQQDQILTIGGVGAIQPMLQNAVANLEQTIQEANNNPTATMLTTNQHGLARIERDGPIFRFNGFPLNSTTIKLVWSLKSSTQADHFNIIYGPIPEGPNVYRVDKLNGTLRDYTFHELEPDKMYQFQLDGIFNGVLYNKQQLTMVKTPPLTANNVQLRSQQDTISSSIMPFGVKAETKSFNSIQLSWNEQERPLSIKNALKVNIIRYYINPSPQQQQQHSQSNESSPTSSTNNSPVAPQYHYLNITNERSSRVVIQKLKPGTEYAFSVKTAYYAPDLKKIILQSMFSMDTMAKTLDLEPTPPRNFTIKIQSANLANLPNGSQQQNNELVSQQQEVRLELSWLPPESSNGQLKGYVILYAYELSQPDERWSRIEIKEANINTWYVSNLRSGINYYFKMRAINQKGQSGDSDIRHYVAPIINSDRMASIPYNNKLLLFVMVCIGVISVLAMIIFKLLTCSNSSSSKRKARSKNGTLKLQKQQQKNNNLINSNSSLNAAKLNGFAPISSSSTVAARVGTIARRRENAAIASNGKQDFWINAMEQPDVKTNISEKSNSDINMAMVSIQRDSPAQFTTTTTQLAPSLPEYRLVASNGISPADQQMMQQIQQQASHYHPSQFNGNSFAFDQMDNATANALMTLSKRQQQQMQKYQIQFATTGNVNPIVTGSQLMQNNAQQQAPSPHQQPPPPPPLNIEQQQQQQQHQSIYGTNRNMRSHRPAVYDPVSGSFLQNMLENNAGPPNYNSSHLGSFHQPHQSSTLLSRRSTNTLRSFQTANLNQFQHQPTYGQMMGGQQQQQQQQLSFGNQTLQQTNNQSGNLNTGQLMQTHQAVINQLNNSTYPSLPLKLTNVSAVRPQIMSSLEDQIEMELAEKEQDQQLTSQQDQQQQQQQQSNQMSQPTIKQ